MTCSIPIPHTQKCEPKKNQRLQFVRLKCSVKIFKSRVMGSEKLNQVITVLAGHPDIRHDLNCNRQGHTCSYATKMKEQNGTMVLIDNMIVPGF